MNEVALFSVAARWRRLGWRRAGSQPAAFQNKGNQGEQNKYTRHPKKPIVMQGLPGRVSRIAVAVSFVGVMMVLAHVGFRVIPFSPTLAEM